MKNLTIAALLVITACGTENDDKATKSDAAAEKQKLQSIALKTKDDLPSCNKANDTQLAYIRDEKQFYVCESSDWVAVDPPIEAKSVNGRDGSNGEDGTTVTTNNWFDAVTGKLWLIGAVVHISAIDAACIAPWRLPTAAEALGAMQRGLGVAATTVNGPTSAWTSTPYVPSSGAGSQTFIASVNTAPALAESIISLGQSKGLFCIEE
jgi:hypothetical protein